MKARWVIAVAALQALVLAFMAGQREWISRFGEQITLRTAPIDPNDPMRGAYVRLNYELGWVPAALCKDGPADWTKLTDFRTQRALRDRVVYAALRVDEHGIANLVSLSDRRPEEGPFLRGRVLSASQGHIQVRYGVEALFMNKASAREVEHAALEEKVGAPMNVRIAASRSGIGVLKDFEWEPLGITLEFDRLPRDAAQNPGNAQPRLTGLTVKIHNYSNEDVAVVDQPGGHSFRLIPNDRFQPVHYEWAIEERLPKVPEPLPRDIVVIKPGAVHSAHIDLRDERWWIIDTRKPGSGPIPMQETQDGWSASFRIEYAPPVAAAIAGLPNAGLVRHTALRSRAFNTSRGID